MNIFLFKSFIIFIISIISWSGAFYYYSTNNENYNDYEYDYETYLFGDSRPFQLKQNLSRYKIFNAAVQGDSYQDIYRRISYISSKTNIKNIIIQSDKHMLTTYRDKHNNNDKTSIFTNLNDWDNSIAYIYGKYIYPIFLDPTMKVVARTAVYNVMSSLLRKVFKSNNISIPINQNFNEKKLLKRYNLQIGNQMQSSIQHKYLYKIIQFCELNNIDLFAINFPLQAKYLELVKRSKIDINKIMGRENIMLFDYSDRFINNDNYFLDQDHLNNLGANKLVEVFIDDFVK